MAATHRGVRLYGALVLMVALSAVVFWVIGFLPWVLAGFALPPSLARGTAEGLAGVRLAVPLVVALLPQLVASALIGGVLSGMVPIAFPRVPRLLGVVLTGCVVLLETTVLLVISRRALEQHASVQIGGDQRVIEGLVLAMVCASALGLAVGLAATVRHGLVAIAGALVAAAVPPWLAAFPGIGPGLLPDLVAAAALLAGLLVSVHRTRLSALLWPLAFLVAWSGAPTAAAARDVVSGLGPGAVEGLGTLVHRAGRVLVEHAGPSDQRWWPWALVAALAVIWLLRPRNARATGRDDTATPAQDPSAPPGPASRPAGRIAPERGKHTATRRA